MQKRKGFTLVELVIVIAVIAILAGVLIGTFASVINRANDSAKLQELKAQEIEQKANDIIEKINDSNWFGWEDYEADIVAKLTEAYQKNTSATITSDEVKKAVNDAVTTALANKKVGTSDLTEDQVKAIVENALGTVKFEGVTEAQVKAALTVALTDVSTLTSAQVKEIVEAANAKNLTAADLAKAVAGCATIEQVKTALSSAAASLATAEQAEAIKNQLNELVLKTTETDNVVLAKALNIQISKLGLTKANVKTPYDAISKLNAEDILKNQSSGNQVMFSLEDVRFFVYDGTTVIYDAATGISSPSYNHWVFANTVDSAYSTYLVGDGVNTTQTANGVGLDVGEATVESVTYSHESGEGRTVVIRTNGGTLTIIAPADTVNHYGDADSVNIVSIASASYHENGRVPFIQISKGRIEIEATGDVNGIHVANVQVVDLEGNITKTDNTFTGNVVLTLNGNEVKLTRDTIGTNISEAVLVCAVDVSDSAATEYIWLVGDGTIENSKVVVTASTTYDSTKTVTKDTASAAAVAIANNAENTGTAESPVYTAHEAGVNAADAEVASALKGTGTETDPFLVYDYATMQKISDFYDKGYHYFAVDMSKTDNGNIDCSNWSPININGSFDGKGVKLNNIDSRLFMNIGELGQNGNVSSWSTAPVTIENFDCYFKLEGDMDAAGGMAKQILGNNTTTLSNINIYGQIVSGSNSGALFSYSTGNPYDANQSVNQTILINDCKIYATLVSTSSSVAVVAGYPDYCNDTLRLVINNPEEIWQGSASNPTGKIKFVSMSGWNVPEGNTQNQTINCNKLESVTLTKNSDGSHSVAQTANATKVKVYISAQLTETDNNGNQTPVAGITMSIKYLGEYDLNGSTQVLESFNNFNYSNKAKESTASIANNTLSVSVGGTNNFTFGSIKLVIVETDSNGNVLSYNVRNIVEKTINGDWVIK